MESIAYKLHKLFNGLPRHSYPFKHYLQKLPKNGIYIKFQVGELCYNLDRIVRVGTDRGENQLQSRLLQHFLNENQRRSIFRKNIGRCFLNQSNDEYLKSWDLNFTSKADKVLNSKLVDLAYELKVEKKISSYIQENFTFCVFELNTKAERLFWETKIIATLGKDSFIKSSSKWLGNYSPKERIKESGLWQIQGLGGESLTSEEFNELDNIVKSQKFVSPIGI
jgi:hypothetical protein